MRSYVDVNKKMKGSFEMSSEVRIILFAHSFQYKGLIGQISCKFVSNCCFRMWHNVGNAVSDHSFSLLTN